MRNMLIAAIGSAALSGCAVTPAATSKAAATMTTDALSDVETSVKVLKEADGRPVGLIAIVQVEDGVRVGIRLSQMLPGTYAVHIHTVGRCDAPDFTTAGAHWNPTGRQHGRGNPQGAHLGDLPNIAVGNDNDGSVAFTIAGARLSDGPNPLYDADGASVIVHAAADDYRTDPSGNSGARLACGVLGVDSD